MVLPFCVSHQKHTEIKGSLSVSIELRLLQQWRNVGAKCVIITPLQMSQK